MTINNEIKAALANLDNAIANNDAAAVDALASELGVLGFCVDVGGEDFGLVLQGLAKAEAFKAA